MARDRSGYHHGDLKAALIAAADAIIREKGIEAFSLREAARRAKVSAGAPAHHFNGVKGLLTEVALLGYEELARYLEEGAGAGEPEVRLRRIALAYVTFALDHPGRFRLMFRHDLIDRADPRYQEVSMRALGGLALAAQGTNAPHLDLSDPEVAGRVFTAWSTIHGMAHLVIEDKGQYLFPEPDARRIVDEILPRILSSLWGDTSSRDLPES